jgi:3alpha(or 20beta)-hydroxysteroid dehydrogenase
VTGRAEGKVVVITGGAGGQGAAEARALAAEGAAVHVTDIKDPVDPLPDGVAFHRLDSSSAGDWRELARILREEHGRVDGLVNNAAATSRARLMDVELDDWRRILEIDVTGPLIGIQTLVPLMSEGGSIVNVCSLAALGGHFTTSYTAAKWALRGLSRVASMELGPLGIRVNAIFPGYVESAMTATAAPSFRELSVKEIPMGRVGRPEDVAPLIVYLISEESSWVSGAEISIDGGEWAHGGLKSLSDGVRRLSGR